MSRYAAVIFDLDGVLVDTEIWWDEVRRDFALEQGRAWTAADRTAVMGANSRQWSRTMVERLALDMRPAEVERRIVDGMIERYRLARETGRLPDGTPIASPVIPGAVEAVRSLAARYPLAVASSAHQAVIEAALQATGLTDAFRVVASSDEVPHGKPSPDVYQLAAERLRVEPGACLVVEDSLNGVLAASAAGMTVVLIPNASVPPADGALAAADTVLGSIGDLDPRHVPGL